MDLANVSASHASHEAMHSLQEDDEAPILSAEEEMQYQRALWVNRLMKEKIAMQTQGLSIKEIEAAQAEIQARMRRESQQNRMLLEQAWPREPLSARQQRLMPHGNAKGLLGGSFSARGASAIAPSAPLVASAAINRRRQAEQIKHDNLAFLKRLEGVKSSFADKVTPPNQIPRISPCNRILIDPRNFR
eukprot:gnl/TRDRNA2_/TRDRNA2_186046_c0_seq1.p1 gnl/TRDRNA2_/TRDRNA2_186046_c0~~gnl/TRDRNA2_/TRDRNA2_186046_c0_seq1.p1  ORF type:complete len:189 (+),score=32.63 gnl/TRDRNA2_/TRDRNA2_186046_c0_seq1:55-621(+)